MYRTSAYRNLLCKFSDCDTMVLHDKNPHLVNELVISRLVEGLSERASLSTDVRPFLNRLYHSLICVMPMALSPKNTRCIFRMVSTWLSSSFWQNLMQYRCSSRSVIFAENNNATRAACTLSLTRWLHATHAVCWRKKKPRMCMKVPSTSHPQQTSRASLVFREKKSRQILFEQATYFTARQETLLSSRASSGRDPFGLQRLRQMSV